MAGPPVGGPRRRERRQTRLRRVFVRIACAWILGSLLLGVLPFRVSATVLGDGGFDSGNLAGPDLPPMAYSFGGWERRDTNGWLATSPNPVHSAPYSAAVDTMTSSIGSFIIQDFNASWTSFRWSFWVYPAQGAEGAAVAFNWDRGLTGSRQTATAIGMSSGRATSVAAWDGSATLAPISFGMWHRIDVLADGCARRQDFWLDGTWWGSAQPSPSLSLPSGLGTVAFGDGTYTASHGEFYWDEFTLAPYNCGFLPDLAIPDGGMSATPSSPPPGESVFLVAIVWNLGNASASNATVAFFFDSNGNRGPDPGETFATQVVPNLDPGMGTTLATTWRASGVGPHSLCAYADPADTIVERDETNNVGCTEVDVLSSPPDYTPANTVPSNTVVAGMSKAVRLTLDVRNVGGSAPNASTEIAFFNGTAPSPPFATVAVSPVAPDGTAGPFSATWASPSTPGMYAVTAFVDAANQVAESNETNNAYTWTIDVVAGPATSLVVGSPNYTAGSTYISSRTVLSFSIQDPGQTGIRRTMYHVDREWWGNFTATGPFQLYAEGGRLLEWHSEDRAGNVEPSRAATLIVDNTPPRTTVSPATGPFSPDTVFRLAATDTASGVAGTEYRIDQGPWVAYDSGFRVSSGEHRIDFRSVDHVGNRESEGTIYVASATSPLNASVNWKPFVAAFFAFFLAGFGALAARLAPMVGRSGKPSAVAAFAAVALPFVIAEIATGVVSFYTGLLSIPPILGWGTGVDLTILITGFVTSLIRVRSRRYWPAGTLAAPPEAL